MNVLLGVLTLLSMIVCVAAVNDYEGGVAGWALAFTILFGAGALHTSSDGWKAARAEDDARNAAREAAERQPHVIREADGCKVYAFKVDGRYSYFTRCKDTTTTESSYTVRSGKSSRTETESITQQNVKVLP